MTTPRHPASTEAALMRAIRRLAADGLLEEAALVVSPRALSPQNAIDNLRHMSNPNHSHQISLDAALELDIWLRQHGYPSWLIESYLIRYRQAAGDPQNAPMSLGELLLAHLRVGHHAGRFSTAALDAASDNHLSLEERRDLAGIAREWGDELIDYANRLLPIRSERRGGE